MEQEQLEAAARSVGAKLQEFQDGLTADERRMLDLAFGAVAAARSEEDVAGHIIGVFTMPTVVAALRQLAEDSNLIDWVGQQMYSGGKT